MRGPGKERLGQRMVRALRKAVLVVVFGLAILSLVAFGMVEHTSQPAYCGTCHIMEPYYTSWEHSSHSDIACIECHFEPGAVETFEGKFKAISQLAKYVTRTEGTKPWAEVSDQSCMRSGCHSTRTLEGPITFGRVKFDHRHHLLESRRGRRLRCVSCHSHIVQGEHMTVTESVCFTCHFMPGPDGTIPEKTGDCQVCHGPPRDVVDVAGKPFEHGEYVARGVDCRLCHDPVVEGDGAVPRERCHSCHAEVGHIERYGETAFLHEMHVTEHKVECFECHQDIRHGLLPLKHPAQEPGEGCGSCHSAAHSPSELLYSGTGAIGVEDMPSRMHETRVVCKACHTGRMASPEVRRGGDGDSPHGAGGVGSPHGGPWAATVAAADEVDCLHCHGPEYHGMLGRWQSSVTGQLDRLSPLLEALELDVQETADPELRALLDEAWHNVELVASDGSQGVHNVAYALAALRASAERIDRARALLDPATPATASEGFPLRAPNGCTDSCHVGVEQAGAVPLEDRLFPHRLHIVDARLDCASCHSVEEHGAPSFPRNRCGDCHHQESEERDVTDCASCHATQEAMLVGELEGFEPLEGVMAEMECADCHGEPPELIEQGPQLCVLCHEEGYDEMYIDWQRTSRRLQAELESALRDSAASAAPERLRAAREVLRVITADGSAGAHNFDLTKRLLEEAADGLRDG